MSEYVAPLRDMQFVLRELAGLDAVGGLPGYEEVNEELASAILEEAGKFASGVLSPLVETTMVRPKTALYPRNRITESLK